MKSLDFAAIKPNARADWLSTDSSPEWDAFLPLCDPKTKAGTERNKERAIFKLFSLGLASNRDDWAYDFSSENLARKIEYFQNEFNSERELVRSGQSRSNSRTVKWGSELEASLNQSTPMSFDTNLVQQASYRPFVKRFYYHDDRIIHRFYQANRLIGLPPHPDDRVLTFLCVSSDKPLSTLATSNIFDLCYTKVGNG